MKTIRQGVLPDTQVYRAKCGYCKTEVEFERHEARTSPDQRDSGVLIVGCPLCKRDIFINARN